MKSKVEVQMSRPMYGDGRKAMNISVRDAISSTRFLEIEIPYDEFVVALTSGIGCGVGEFRDLDVIGKRRESRRFTFPFNSKDIAHKEYATKAYEAALEYCPEGWQPQNYFGSKDSFGDGWAACTIFRYIETTEQERLND